MKFGIFDHMERNSSDVSGLYEDRLQLLERADEAGFWCYHKAEHHFIDLDAAPSSNLFLSALSQRTGRLRFGPLVYLLPFYHPIRLIEEICALDHLCGGRLEIGVGKGISPPEHLLWGLESDTARDRFEEALTVVLDGLMSGVVDFAGEFYRFDNVAINMRPFDDRMPGMWYAGNAEYAGRNRMSTVVSGPVDAIEDMSRRYDQALRTPERDANSGVASPTFAVKRHLYIARSDEEAHDRVARAYPVYHRNLARLWKAHDVPFPNRDPSFGGDMHAAMLAQDLVIGSVETVARHIEELVSRVGVTYFIGAFAWGDLSHRESLDSMERFAQEIMPRFAT
jgi:alkanesulfonate monooxygenase SsuD/methylene tetrahydromethanopterin reductase-like flavin-dependent oxidoreductase (luciferase family)